MKERDLTMKGVKGSSQVRINHIEKKKHFVSSQDLQEEIVLVEGAQILRLKLNITRIKVSFIFSCTVQRTFSFFH
jgi:hypothetical protein